MSSTSIESKSDSEEFEDAIDTLEIQHQTAQPELDASMQQNVNLNQQKPPKFTHQPSIPPPMGPPPPLPEQFLQNPKSPPTQIPPPLPPRRPVPRNQSPSAALPSITVPEKKEIQTEKSSTDQQQSYGRQRGHTKTNSLDRGLISLAKCMKTGPFPPPTTSKSNSLTRGASPSDILPTVDEQDTQAQGVIQGVIQQVLLSDNTSLADENDFNKEATTSSDISPEKKMENHNKIKENIIPVDDKIQLNSSTSQTIINRRKAKSTGGCSSADEKSNEIAPAGLAKQKSIVPHYENLAEQSLPKEYSSNNQPEISSKLEDEKKQKITTKGNSKKRIDEKQHRRSASDKSPTKMKASVGHHQKQKSSTWEPNQKTGLLQKPESIDPITRDVERRISLKEKGNLSNTKQNDHNETNDASSSEEVFGQKHSAKEHIRRFARNYGTVASDYLRGTVQKVRQHAAILTKNTSKSGKIVGAENDSRDGASSVADSDELSLANCISESLPVPMTTPIGRRMRATNSAEPPNSSRPTSAATTSSTVGICRPKNVKKGPFDFEQLRLVQELNHEHTGAIWCIKFSDCGRLLATAGQDRNVRVWVLRSQLNYFTSLRERYGQEVGSNLDYSLMQHIGNMRPDLYESVVEEEKEDENGVDEKIGNGKEMDEKMNSNSSKGQGPKGSLASSSSSFSSRPQSAGGISTKAQQFQTKANSSSSCPSNFAIFSPKPFCVFRGHTADVLDLSWSPRNYFILSSGMDRTVKLWHLTRNECLCSFQHLDFVTCIAFMPKDDRYFISGSLDGKIRLWNIPEKRVAVWNEVEQVVKYITAIAFVKNGKFVVVGTYSGRCFFYSTDQLKYHTVIDARSSKAKNSRENDKTKITALGVHGDKLLVTSNDSRIRIYDLRDMDLCCKFKGAQIEQSHIRAAFSPDGKYIVSGSEDNFVYLWRTSSSTVRKDRNHAWERIRAHQTVVTTAAFAPKPQLILSWLIEQQQKMKMEPIASSTPEPSENNISPSPPKMATKAEKNGGQTQSAKERYSNSVERPFLALASKLALPTANLTDIQLIRRSVNNRPLNASSLGYSSSMLSIASAATHQSVNETIGNGRDRRAMGDVIVSADLGGSLKIFVNAIRLQTGASNFFPY